MIAEIVSIGDEILIGKKIEQKGEKFSLKSSRGYDNQGRDLHAANASSTIQLLI